MELSVSFGINWYNLHFLQKKVVSYTVFTKTGEFFLLFPLNIIVHYKHRFE